MDKNPLTENNEQENTENMPDNYLAFAVICTIVCFAPVGIIALYYSLRVNQLWQEKKIAQAQKVSKITRIACICTIVAGIVFWIGILSGAVFNIFGTGIYP